MHKRAVNKAINAFTLVRKWFTIILGRQSRKWRACCNRNGVNKNIGRYSTEVEAFNAYEKYMEDFN